MTDLSEVLPDFDSRPWRHLIHSLEKYDVTVSELISVDAIEIARRCPLPLNDLKAMIKEVILAMQIDLGLVASDVMSNNQAATGLVLERGSQHSNAKSLPRKAAAVQTLDSAIDECLGGGFQVGHVSEIVGESAVGKTQFVLGLLLSVQLPAPRGLGRSAIYLSTEAPLNTTRLHQMLSSHPVFAQLAPGQRPTLDKIHAIRTNDLETQEHIISYQLPLAVQRFDAGLVVMDSVAANFRAERETNSVQGLADRANDLMKLGHMLRHIARDLSVAVVVTNQVSDRFDDVKLSEDRVLSSPLAPHLSSSPAPPGQTQVQTQSQPVQQDEMSFDHQQRFFTGWGNQPSMHEQQKTPALGLTWANQLSARIVLKMESERMNQLPPNYVGGNIWKDKKKRRLLSVVFSPWAPPTLTPVRYEIQAHGVTSQLDAEYDPPTSQELSQLLDPKLWIDGADDEYG